MSQNDELCTKNENFCIKNEEFVFILNDEFAEQQKQGRRTALTGAAVLRISYYLAALLPLFHQK